MYLGLYLKKRKVEAESSTCIKEGGDREDEENREEDDREEIEILEDDQEARQEIVEIQEEEDGDDRQEENCWNSLRKGWRCQAGGNGLSLVDFDFDKSIDAWSQLKNRRITL